LLGTHNGGHIGALFCNSFRGKEFREESIPTCSATFDLAANGSEIDRLSLIMVIGARVCCMHWVCYMIGYVNFGTVEGIIDGEVLGLNPRQTSKSLMCTEVKWGFWVGRHWWGECPWLQGPSWWAANTLALLHKPA